MSVEGGPMSDERLAEICELLLPSAVLVEARPRRAIADLVIENARLRTVLTQHEAVAKAARETTHGARHCSVWSHALDCDVCANLHGECEVCAALDTLARAALEAQA